MKSYPATIVSVDTQSATVQLEQTGQKIVFDNAGFNAIPAALRQVGTRGYIHFPTPPPSFVRAAA
jgi:hypothetical protein